MKQWQKDLLTFEAGNEQEEKDLQAFQYAFTYFKDVLTRENPIAHMTVSAFVVNEARTHTLMVYHNIYDSWAWTGGHADGEDDFLAVALREVKEETGIQARPVSEQPISIEQLTVLGHMKKGAYVSEHLHMNVTYLVEADDQLPLTICEDENSDVAWLPIAQLHEKCKELHMIPIYDKIINRL
ncbi:NUDIX hydrolase [Kurthia zopfii]|uniref:NUDIX hydrolase n=1 Tax=Kurthia zopfii TaxID=1650 RepID=UPI000F6FF014|nr:NUDIX hydrolase [Kurthia zopfii]VEI06308.1 NUDIX domain [Kurthia zopfii]